jgi:CubicO group peptidase (beta-lactamase class C family)
MTTAVRTPTIDRAIDQAVADRRIVGAVVLVAQDGKTVYRRAAGLADREAGTPMREDAVFRLSSLTKPLVTAAALRMAELGKIALGDPVTRYLPDFRPALPDGSMPVITLKHLLTHTAGLGYGFMQQPDGPYHREKVSDGLDAPGLSMRDELARLVRAGLFFRPGERWDYSLGMDVLGAALEVADGRDLEAIMAAYVSGPLKLASMGFDLKDGQREKLAPHYADHKGLPPTRIPDAGCVVTFPDGIPIYAGLAGISLSPARAYDPSSFRSSGAGMVGNAPDMLAFVEAIRTGGAPIVSRDIAAAMMTVQTDALEVPNRGPGWSFGFGGAILTDPKAAASPQSRGTYGWGGVWGHTWFIDPAKKVSMVSLTNTTLEGMMGRYTRDLRDAVYVDLA